MTQKRYPALGRGLDALISTEEVHTSGSSSISEVPVASIKANPNQPRREFDEDALAELAESIRQIGIIQPITLRRMDDGCYQIIAGERRWRASQMAGLQTIPAYIRTADDENMMQMALVENIQREDLNAIEIALAYQNLIERYGLTQDRLSEKVGKNRATIANCLRLLKLPAQVQVALQNKEIDPGHARALLGLSNPTLQLKLFAETREKGYSVRQIEEMVKAINNGETVKSGRHTLTDRNKKRLPEEYGVLRTRLSDFFQTKVQMTVSSQGKGKISIPFASEEELERIMALFDKIKGHKD
jgi:ParB family transcriptional regulator, chromosome partitioning protein